MLKHRKDNLENQIKKHIEATQKFVSQFNARPSMFGGSVLKKDKSTNVK